jgi:hypothetical protein
MAAERIIPAFEKMDWFPAMALTMLMTADTAKTTNQNRRLLVALAEVDWSAALCCVVMFSI